MVIPREHSERFIYHFTHLDNLPGILKNGLLCNNHPDFPKDRCRSVAEPDIQARRAAMNVTCGPGGKVHDYVPLYFGSFSPMLLRVVNQKNVDQMDIVYFEFPMALLDREHVVFTDASANTTEPPNFYADAHDLNKLNWTEIDSLKWSSADETLRHQRMSEVLVHQHLSVSEAKRVVVWNKTIAEKVKQLAEKAGVSLPPIGYQVRPRYHYITKFFSKDQDERLRSVVCGPKSIASAHKLARDEIAEKGGKTEGARYETPQKLLEALRENLASLPQTAELVELKSENGIHKLTVDQHTLEVVKRLKGLSRFKDLDPQVQDRVELAAFLHDIGKGPKSRWASNGGLQKVDADHPVRAMPMMVDILTQQIARVQQEDAELITKLVCYHDLVGDVLGKGRDEKQIVDVADNETELAALFAIGEADATSLREEWWDEKLAAEIYERCRQAIQKKGK